MGFRLRNYSRYWSWQATGLLVLVALIAGVWVLLRPADVDLYAWLYRHQQGVEAWVTAHRWLAALLFVLVFITGVTLSLPVTGTFIVLSGFLFGIVPGTMLSVLGASLGAATFLFLAQTALGDRIRRNPAINEKQGVWQRLMHGLRRDASHYLLAVRLFPVVPFFVVNVASALLGMRLRVFLPITFFGMIPSTLVIASLGAGLGSILSRGERPDFGVLYEPPILLPLLGLASLVLLPVFYRRWVARHPEAER